MMLQTWMHLLIQVTALRLLCAQARRKRGMSLYRRDDVWYYLFYQNGKRYRGSTGVKVAGRGAERAARDVVAEKRRAIREGEDPKPKRVPLLRDFISQFSEWVKTINKAPKTRSDYLNGCRLILAADMSGMRLDRITAGDIEATRFHKSPYSANCALRTLRRVFHRAFEKEVIRKIPRIKLLYAPRREAMVSMDDELRLLKAIEHANEMRRYKKREPAPLREVFTIMLDCGMRPSEVVAMRWENVHLVEAFYSNPKGKTRNARRRVPLSERVLVILQSKIQCDKREGWIFPSQTSNSGHIELGAIQRKFRSIARVLGIPDQLKLYCARHTFGTVAMAEAKDPGLVRETMGHGDLNTTMVYMHPDIDRIKAIIDRRNASKMVQ
jgi:integrase